MRHHLAQQPFEFGGIVRVNRVSNGDIQDRVFAVAARDMTRKAFDSVSPPEKKVTACNTTIRHRSKNGRESQKLGDRLDPGREPAATNRVAQVTEQGIGNAYSAPAL